MCGGEGGRSGWEGIYAFILVTGEIERSDPQLPHQENKPHAYQR